MDLTPYFQSVLELDTAPLVLCDRNHTIVYMNPEAARRYAKRGGYSLVGKNLLDCHNEASRAAITEILHWFEADPRNNRVFTGSARMSTWSPCVTEPGTSSAIMRSTLPGRRKPARPIP